MTITRQIALVSSTFLLCLCLGFVIGVEAGCHVQSTPVATVADTVTRLEQTADAIVKAAQTANTSTPKLISDAALITVAMAGDRIGRVGSDLANALTAYDAAKAAGSDVTAQAAAVHGLLTSVTQALSDVGKAVPSGTVASIDASITTALAIVAQIQAARAGL